MSQMSRQLGLCRALRPSRGLRLPLPQRLAGDPRLRLRTLLLRAAGASRGVRPSQLGRLLTQFVRLPLPSSQQLDAATATGTDYENMGIEEIC